jgi:hypothetical protein
MPPLKTFQVVFDKDTVFGQVKAYTFESAKVIADKYFNCYSHLVEL